MSTERNKTTDGPGDPFPEDLEYLVDGKWIAEADLTDEQKATWLDEVLL